MSISCREEGCVHAPFKNPSAERMHFHRVHSKHIKSALAYSRISRPSKEDRRSKKWRAAHPKEAKYIGQSVRRTFRRKVARTISRNGKHDLEIRVNFCPQCGCHIQTVALGMALATQINTTR